MESLSLKDYMEQQRCYYINQVLKEEPNITKASEILGITRQHLHRFIKEQNENFSINNN